MMKMNEDGELAGTNQIGAKHHAWVAGANLSGADMHGATMAKARVGCCSCSPHSALISTPIRSHGGPASTTFGRTG